MELNQVAAHAPTTLAGFLAQWGDVTSTSEGVYTVEGDYPLYYGSLKSVREAVVASLNKFGGDVLSPTVVGFHFEDGWKAVGFSYQFTPQGWVEY